MKQIVERVIKETETSLINSCLEEGLSQTKSAEKLGISSKTLRAKMRAYDIDMPTRWSMPTKTAKKLDSMRLITYFQEGLKLKEIAELMSTQERPCKPYMVTKALIEILGEKKYNQLKDVYRYCKRENMDVPKEYKLQ